MDQSFPNCGISGIAWRGGDDWGGLPWVPHLGAGRRVDSHAAQAPSEQSNVLHLAAERPSHPYVQLWPTIIMSLLNYFQMPSFTSMHHTLADPDLPLAEALATWHGKGVVMQSGGSCTRGWHPPGGEQSSSATVWNNSTAELWSKCHEDLWKFVPLWLSDSPLTQNLHSQGMWMLFSIWGSYLLMSLKLQVCAANGKFFSPLLLSHWQF